MVPFSHCSGKTQIFSGAALLLKHACPRVLRSDHGPLHESENSPDIKTNMTCAFNNNTQKVGRTCDESEYGLGPRKSENTSLAAAPFHPQRSFTARVRQRDLMVLRAEGGKHTQERPAEGSGRAGRRRP